jgi:hypothetical protein
VFAPSNAADSVAGVSMSAETTSAPRAVKAWELLLKVFRVSGRNFPTWFLEEDARQKAALIASGSDDNDEL